MFELNGAIDLIWRQFDDFNDFTEEWLSHKLFRNVLKLDQLE